MDRDTELERLKAQIEAAEAERDRAVEALEQQRKDAEEQTQLLTAEQDRFVSHLLAANDEELSKAHKNFEELQTTVSELRTELAKLRERSLRYEDEIHKIVTERDGMKAELDMARTLLGYAMDSVPPPSERNALSSMPVARTTGNPPKTKPPLQSVVVPKGERQRRSTPPGTRAARRNRTPRPRQLAVNDPAAVSDSVAPKSEDD